MKKDDGDLNQGRIRNNKNESRRAWNADPSYYWTVDPTSEDEDEFHGLMSSSAPQPAFSTVSTVAVALPATCGLRLLEDDDNDHTATRTTRPTPAPASSTRDPLALEHSFWQSRLSCVEEERDDNSRDPHCPISPTSGLRVDELDDDDDDEEPLYCLRNVTALSRSLIRPELLYAPKKSSKKQLFHYYHSPRMATTATSTVSSLSKSKRGMFRRSSSSTASSDPVAPPAQDSGTTEDGPRRLERRKSSRNSTSKRSFKGAGSMSLAGASAIGGTELGLVEAAASFDEFDPACARGRKRDESPPPKMGLLSRVRSRSRSLSASRSVRKPLEEDGNDEGLAMPTIVAVTSCRSDAYYSQKAPGSISKMPRKAPSALKTFHELAVGLKDAYAAMGETPVQPDETNPTPNAPNTVLFEFMSNLDFLLALVDEVAMDTATRGALKDDTTFKALRDVIKKCNKVLETMLVRREKKYTLFFRLVQTNEDVEIDKIKAWNQKVEKAVSGVADSKAQAETNNGATTTDTASDTASETASTLSMASSTKSSSSGSMFARGRSLLPTAGRVRARRATPTPSLRRRGSQQDSTASEDGFSAVTAPVTTGNLARLQQSLGEQQGMGPMGLSMVAGVQKLQQPAQPIQPKDELVDVIRGLRNEKKGIGANDIGILKPTWRPKAQIPIAVPKLPTEYIHRHRLMKQVVNCLLEPTGVPQRATDDDGPKNAIITTITSRHADKAGNGKTTLAVAAIQTVEVRERFSDGIAWLKLGRTPLAEKDIRRLYEELHHQLLSVESHTDDDDSENKDGLNPNGRANSGDSSSRTSSLSGEKDERESDSLTAVQLAKSRRRFQGGELEGMKQDLGRMLCNRKVLICMDDVWRLEDAKWFMFESGKDPTRHHDKAKSEKS
eukprot:scaffold21034_cov42-Attheya_sp.AAC.2